MANFMAAVIAEAAALMSSRRKAAADNETTMVAAVAVAVGASAAAASDAGAGEKSSLTTSADYTAVDISGSHRCRVMFPDNAELRRLLPRLQTKSKLSLPSR
jgi:hypothetical protein